MISDLSLWIKQIIIVVIFSTFIDFILPSGGFKRYTKALLGLVVMLTILNPLLLFLNKNYVFEEVIWKYQDLIDNDEVAAMAEVFNEKNHQLIIDEYKKRISEQVVRAVTDKIPFEVKKIDVKIIENREDENFGKINEIHIWLKDNFRETKIKEIEKVSVTINNGTLNRIYDEKEEHQIERLKEYLSQILDVNIRDIYFYY